MRVIRKALNAALPILGMAIVFGAVLFVPPEDRQLQIIAVLVGIVLIESSVWKVTNPFLPSERRYAELRQEVDRFIGRVRELNSAAEVHRMEGSLETRQRYEDALSSMHRSVERMGEVAGKAVPDEDEEDLLASGDEAASGATGPV